VVTTNRTTVKYKNIKVNSCGVTDRQRKTSKLLHSILEDYCLRFGLTPPEHRVNIDVAYADFEFIHEYDGITVIDSESDTLTRIFVQVRDPLLDGVELNKPVVRLFDQTVCHEFIHVCQYLTGRAGMRVKGIMDKTSSRELYCFDTMEVEARVLQDLYTDLYVRDLL
jgi:hypothetical protein